MSIVMIALVLFSVVFIAEEIGHDCSGEDCPICESLEQCRKAVRCVGEIFTSIILATLFMVAMTLVITEFRSVLLKRTLVSQKVRMND